jgi:hypothetical protein
MFAYEGVHSLYGFLHLALHNTPQSLILLLATGRKLTAAPDRIAS